MSFHENTELHIKSACLFELKQAEKEWGETYHSLHEGWAVLKEEIDEVQCEIADIDCDFKGLWNCIVNNNALNDGVQYIQKSAIRAMKELAQVWAVCEKMKKTAKKEGE